ncbi:carbohydrate ABC transporter permease [Stackebrandtia nassauensis]|uniref:Binding-protein-dependent transport systems inner membrane component n=1 Tax=Stackebrandtia nassauensis (strain DSM 44728 / CIP 108903 / NRRL B-16338 / NBRC 102104 / LLR-40K-21) TaxID=446470 RepID=D3PY55_STANL|nr:carbohydrate ABC transporter permease [Stackebrandtia nassauensis]ADD45384.1 binding-protein-dependent transport systems inner membrane component [Stackebrandtia nassauensis DSM 44728]
MSAHRPAWMGKPSPLVKAAKAVALVIVVALVLFPFWTIVATSIASPEEVIDNGGWVVIPTSFSFKAYEDIISGGIITDALLRSVGITVVGTLLSLVATVFLAYALSRPGVVGGKPILLLILFTFLFPPAMIPSYLVVQELGLKENYLSLILPVLVNVFNLVVMRGFFQSVPGELIEAARLDGAGDFRILTRVVMPLSKAVIAVVGLFYAVAYWNSFFTAILYLDSDQWPVQAILRQYVTQNTAISDTAESTVQNSPQSTKMAVVVLATLPIVIVYPFVQRFFAKGVLTGAIKS